MHEPSVALDDKRVRSPERCIRAAAEAEESLDRRLLMIPGTKPPDTFASTAVDVGNNGLVMAAGKTVSGPVAVDDWGTSMQFQNASLGKRTVAGAL